MNTLHWLGEFFTKYFLSLLSLTVLQHHQENIILFPCLCLNQVMSHHTSYLYIKMFCQYHFPITFNHASRVLFHFSLLLDHFMSYWIISLQPIMLLTNSVFPFPLLFFLPHTYSAIFSAIHTHTNIAHPDHTRKIELIRYLVSGYVNGKVLDTLSEHANALASSAVASLEDEADQLSHFPFLSALHDHVFTVPKHHGWYRRTL